MDAFDKAKAQVLSCHQQALTAVAEGQLEALPELLNQRQQALENCMAVVASHEQTFRELAEQVLADDQLVLPKLLQNKSTAADALLRQTRTKQALKQYQVISHRA